MADIWSLLSDISTNLSSISNQIYELQNLKAKELRVSTVQTMADQIMTKLGTVTDDLQQIEAALNQAVTAAQAQQILDTANVISQEIVNLKAKLAI